MENLKQDYAVLAATSGAKALELAARNPRPDVILMDVMMPGIDGYETCRRLKQHPELRDIDVLFISANNSAEEKIIGYKAGGSDYLVKPVQFPELHEKLKLAIRNREAHAESARTYRKLEEAQGQLLQSEKMAAIGQLAAGVAHEINNPVGYITSNIGALQGYIDELFRILEAYERMEASIADGNPAKAEVATLKQQTDLGFLKQDITDLLKESREGVTRVRQIVQDLKDFSRVDEAEWQWTDLHKGIDSTLNIVHNEIKYKAEVIKNYGTLPLVECIASQINQVIMNLLVNAAQAIEQRGTITLSTGVSGDKVWIKISDTGKGIPEQNLRKIFDPFFTTKPVGKGTGLGLSLSYGIIERHAGSIDVHSEVGKGTTFTITLPVKQAIPKADH
ncbi:MAG: response regulator [Gammaproteobacteria bacterium]|nr:response regulator [Gammaproteobacteria bacterium]